MRDLPRIENLDVGDRTYIHTPDRSITHHVIRRTAEGFETKSALTEWRSITLDEIRAELAEH